MIKKEKMASSISLFNYIACYNFFWTCFSPGQTTQKVSPSFYVLICQSMHVSNEPKIQNWYVVRHTKLVFSKLALLLRVWQSIFFSQNWKEEWNKETRVSVLLSTHRLNFFFLLFKTQVISFLNLKHTIESGGVSVMLNLVFYVFKGKQLK